MSATRPGTAGATRTCPHCKATILESSSVCPQCRGHLRFDAEANTGATLKSTPLQVEGTIPAPADGACEYTMVLAIRDGRGREINRQIVGVGAMQPGEERTFSLVVEATEVPLHRRRKH
ncbi:MAG: hypothetical protein A2579_09765 [Lysobacterales bacterium RIFOXYD1_FULL_69_11]|nr:MAG: hypothetical protein A2190_10605 [Xanthomonadales bacterium RIFOXYA1_FULL_69_10]OHE85968.1 MAG: hypothetical protein A2579_09765 [Xanthomonadales bacterium RIFOXYD1_FULL_69_11]